MKKLLITIVLILLGAGFAFAEYSPSNEARLEYNHGVDFYKANQYDSAMSAFRQAIKIDPNYIDAYYNLGSILEYLKRDEEALAIFKQIIVRQPDDYESVYKAARLSYKLGHTDNAKSYLSLIPSESSIYSAAQLLANAMNTDMQTIKTEENKKEQIPNFGQSNGMYNNIPSPTGIATDRSGNVYVACFSDNMVYKITPDGKRIVYVKDAKINGPIGMAGDSSGNLYISNYNSNNVVKITPSGTISVLISNVKNPYGIHISGNMLFVSSQGSNSVLRYKL